MGAAQLTLAFVGDVSLSCLKQGDPAAGAWQPMRELIGAIGAHDSLVGNLECCLVDARRSCLAYAQRPLTAPATAAPLLSQAGFSALCLANNHMLDCGPQALGITREALAAAGIGTFGAGANLAQAEATLFEVKGGRCIAYLSACDHAEYYATRQSAGIAPLSKYRLGRRVRQATAQADLVVVCLHADLEFCSVPAAWRQRLSRWLIDQGAHLVIQHHPHVLQGIEPYRGGLIAYSLGNFVFPLTGNRYQQHRPGVYDSVVLVVEARFAAQRIVFSYRLVPARIRDDHFPHRLPAAQANQVVGEFQRRCALLSDKKRHRRAWWRRCQQEATMRARGLYYTCGRGQLDQAGQQVVSLVKNKTEHRWLRGLLTWGYF